MKSAIIEGRRCKFVEFVGILFKICIVFLPKNIDEIKLSLVTEYIRFF